MEQLAQAQSFSRRKRIIAHFDSYDVVYNVVYKAFKRKMVGAFVLPDPWP